MRIFYMQSMIALVALICFACDGMQISSQEHRMIAFNDFEIDTQDQIYDDCDSKTQDALRCTSREMHFELSDRWRKRSGMNDLRLAYQSQNPLIALNSHRISKLVFPDEGSDWSSIVLDPRSEAFYKKKSIKRFIHNNPAKSDFLKNEFNSFEGSFGNWETHVGADGKKQTHFWRPANPLLIAVAARDTYSLKEELMCGGYNAYLLNQAKDLAVATKNVPELRAILRYKNDQLRAQKLRWESQGDTQMVDYLNRDAICGLDRDILNAVSNEDDRVFKVFAEESDIGVLTRKIPMCAIMDTDDTIESNLGKLHKQGKCSKDKLDFFRNQLDVKKNPWKRIDREIGNDCTIL